MIPSKNIKKFLPTINYYIYIHHIFFPDVQNVKNKYLF